MLQPWERPKGDSTIEQARSGHVERGDPANGDVGLHQPTLNTHPVLKNTKSTTLHGQLQPFEY